MGESVGREGNDFVNGVGHGVASAVEGAGALLGDDGAVMLEWLPRVLLEELVDESLRELAKQK